MNKSVVECLDYSDVLSHFYRQRGSIEWSSLLCVRVVFGLVYISMLIGGLLSNGSVIRLILAGADLMARNVLLLNLMCADVLICLTAVPITPIAIFWKQWFLGSFMCRCLAFAQSTSVMVISWTLAAIAVDKFVHIQDPSKMSVRKTQGGCMVAVGWLFAVILNLPFAFNYQIKSGSQLDWPGAIAFCGDFCVEDWWRLAGFQRIYGTVVLMAQFGVPILVIGYCYARILHVVHSDLLVSRRRYSSLLSQLQHERACRMQRKATYILLAGVFGFLLAWSPLTAINILKDYGMVPNFVREQVYFCGLVSHSLAMSSVIMNPILCFWLTRQSTKKKPMVPLLLYTRDRMSKSNSKERGRQRDKYVEAGALIIMCDRNNSIVENKEP